MILIRFRWKINNDSRRFWSDIIWPRFIFWFERDLQRKEYIHVNWIYIKMVQNTKRIVTQIKRVAMFTTVTICLPDLSTIWKSVVNIKLAKMMKKDHECVVLRCFEIVHCTLNSQPKYKFLTLVFIVLHCVYRKICLYF